MRGDELDEELRVLEIGVVFLLVVLVEEGVRGLLGFVELQQFLEGVLLQDHFGFQLQENVLHQQTIHYYNACQSHNKQGFYKGGDRKWKRRAEV